MSYGYRVRFYGHVPNSHRNTNLESIDPCLFLKMVFFVQIIAVYLEHKGKNLFPTLNVMIL
jgi:hypothetical protein